MRITLFVIVLAGLFANSSIAQDLTAAETKALKAFLAASGSNYQEQLCLVEHICMLGAPIGRGRFCESKLWGCIEYLNPDPFMPRIAQTACATVLDKMPTSRRALLSAPKGCSTAPPPKAVVPTLTPNEAQCLSAAFGRRTAKRDQKSTAAEIEATIDPVFEKCTRNMAALTAEAREFCRKSLHNIEEGRGFAAECSKEVRKPASARASAIQSTAPAVPANPPRTWQEQVEQTALESEGDSDLDDLDFDLDE